MRTWWMGAGAALVIGAGVGWSAGVFAPPPVAATAPIAPSLAQSEPQARPVPAPPIENWLDPRIEGTHKEHRKAWFRDLHRAPPGVDWKALDREAGVRRMSGRNHRARLRGNTELVTRWVERGSDNQSGRAHTVAHSSDGATLYVGSALGGVWKGTHEGADWAPIGDNVYGGVHQLVVLPPTTSGAPDRLFGVTNDGAAYASADDGATWEPSTGLDWAYRNHTLLRTSDAAAVVFLVRQDFDGTAVYRSTDAGRSFTLAHDCLDFVCDVWTARTGDPTVYLADAGRVYLSSDHGVSFSLQGTIDTDAVAVRLAGSEAGAPRLYAMAEVSDRWILYRSDDDGSSWAVVYNDVSDFWGRLTASIVDPDVVAWSGVELHVSRDGGLDFGIRNPWWAYYDDIVGMLHADIQGIDVVPDGPGAEIWYVSTDGGPYRSTDQLDTVENLSQSGLRISQYYSTLTSIANPDHVAAGSQDQGLQLTQGVKQDDGLLEFVQVISGDYGHIVSGDGSHDVMFAVYPGSLLAIRGEDEPQIQGIGFPTGETAAGTAAWLPPIQADPTDPRNFYFAGRDLWRFDYQPESDRWRPTRWLDDLELESGEYFSAMEFSPVDADRIYLATNRGRLVRTNNGGRSWREAKERGPGAHFFYGHALHASETDRQVAVVGGSGYGQTAIWRTDDGGRTWYPWDEGLGDTHVYDIAEAPDGSGRLFAATQQAAYVRGWADEGWVDISEDAAPITIFWSVEALASENTMRFGTYGRGIWDYQLDAEGTGCFPVQDFDEDGVLCTMDCDDHDASRMPGAPEVCDDIDTNCDPSEESDLDGDGFISCEDCDDTRADVFPGATEVPRDDIDQDCDGEDRQCGCRAGPAGSGWLVMGLGLLAMRRRKARALVAPTHSR